VTLPLIGTIRLPSLQRLAWYAGIASLVALGMVEWPVAAVVMIGHLLSEDHHNRVIEAFGEALEVPA
jgi:hypothetical protein